MRIGICVVDYGDPKYLRDCLESLCDGKIPEKNDITGSIEIKEEPKYGDYIGVRVFDCNKENIGFTAANNRLLEEWGVGYDFLWILNNDTVVPKETLESIERILPTLDSNIGIIGFQIRSMDNPDFIHHAGTLSCFPAGVHKAGSVKLGHFTKRTFEKWVTFASVLIRAEVFRKVGLLDEGMFNYGSDSDFCYRARAAGFKIVYEPSFVILHKVGQSQNPSPEQQKQIQQDMLYFQNKWLSGKLFFDLDTELLE